MLKRSEAKRAKDGEGEKIVDELNVAISTIISAAEEKLKEAGASVGPPEEPAREGIKILSHTEKDGPRMAADFERVVERVFSRTDAVAEYERLEKELKLGDQRNDFGSLQKALDEAEDNARSAHQLFVQAKAEVKAYELDNEQFLAPFYKKATEALQSEKDGGKRNKSITDGDVRSTIALMYPDVLKDHDSRGAKAKGMVEQVGQLSKLWEGRCATLATLIAHRRK